MRSISNGSIPFDQKIKAITLKEIARHPDTLFDYWICKEFRVLPTSKEFQELTQLQKDLLYESYLAMNPEIEERVNKRNDEEFNEAWEEGNIETTESEIVAEDKFDEFAESAGLTEDQLPASQSREEVLRLIREGREESGELDNISIDFDADDWEEVDE